MQTFTTNYNGKHLCFILILLLRILPSASIRKPQIPIVICPKRQQIKIYVNKFMKYTFWVIETDRHKWSVMKYIITCTQSQSFFFH